MNRRVRTAVTVVVVLSLAGACAAEPPAISGRRTPAITTPLPLGVADPAPPTTITTGPPPCNPSASFRPQGLPTPGQLPAGSTMATIRDSGKLRIAIGIGGNLLSFPNPNTGEMQGFEAGIAREIARAIFGQDGEKKIQYRTINASERIGVLTRGEADLVMAAMTMTCERMQSIAFSADYYTGGQRVLVNRDSTIKSERDLGGKKVCASLSGTNIPIIQSLPVKPVAVGAPNTSDCLLMLQQRQVDAIATGDVILAGLAAQDPGTMIVGERFTSEPTGIGISKQSIDLVRFVNAILEKLKADGTWTALQTQWLAPVIGPAAPPIPQYLPE